MFQSISWTEYFTASLILGCLYYSLAGLILYREELKSFFTEGFGGIQKKSDDIEHDGDASFMGGTARSAAGEEFADEGLQFAPSSRQSLAETFTVAADTTLVGSVADLGEDIKRLSKNLGGMSHEEVGRNFSNLLNRYKKLRSTSYRSTINLLIAETINEKSTERIDAKEVDEWW